MTKLLATCAFLALAVPAFAASSSMTQSRQDVGKPVMGPQNHKIGTVRYLASVDGREAAIMTVPTTMYGNATVALPMTDLKPAKNGDGLAESMSINDLVRLPCALPPCTRQNAATG